MHGCITASLDIHARILHSPALCNQFFMGILWKSSLHHKFIKVLGLAALSRPSACSSLTSPAHSLLVSLSAFSSVGHPPFSLQPVDILPEQKECAIPKDTQHESRHNRPPSKVRVIHLFLHVKPLSFVLLICLLSHHPGSVFENFLI